MNRLHFLLTFVALGLLSSCRPPWTVVQQASPNPLVGVSQFVLEPVSFEGIDAKPEHRSIISSAYPEALSKEASRIGFRRAGSDEDFTIETQVTRLEPGVFGTRQGESSIRVHVRIRQGKRVIDEFTTTGKTTPADAPTSGGIPLGGYDEEARLSDAARKIGRYVGRYLVKRTL